MIFCIDQFLYRLLFATPFIFIYILESKNCNSNLWKFLSVVQIVKANAILHKLEQTKEALEDALPIAHFLKSSELILFIENCMACNTEDSINKRATLMQARRVSKSESVATHSLVSGQDVDSQGG